MAWIQFCIRTKSQHLITRPMVGAATPSFKTTSNTWRKEPIDQI